ncbi:hypothetical protein IWX91DRAFT_327655 [Phyllosticta citricarpa]
MVRLLPHHALLFSLPIFSSTDNPDRLSSFPTFLLVSTPSPLSHQLSHFFLFVCSYIPYLTIHHFQRGVRVEKG